MSVSYETLLALAEQGVNLRIASPEFGITRLVEIARLTKQHGSMLTIFVGDDLEDVDLRLIAEAGGANITLDFIEPDDV